MRQCVLTPLDGRARGLGLRLNSEGEAKLRNKVAEKTRLFPERPCSFERGRYCALFLLFLIVSLESVAVPDPSSTCALRATTSTVFSDRSQDGTGGSNGERTSRGEGRRREAEAGEHKAEIRHTAIQPNTAKQTIITATDCSFFWRLRPSQGQPVHPTRDQRPRRPTHLSAHPLGDTASHSSVAAGKQQSQEERKTNTGSCTFSLITVPCAAADTTFPARQTPQLPPKSSPPGTSRPSKTSPPSHRPQPLPPQNNLSP